MLHTRRCERCGELVRDSVGLWPGLLFFREAKPSSDGVADGSIERVKAHHLHETPTEIPTTIPSRRSGGCCQACSGLIVATTKATVVVIPVVMMSSDRPSRIIAIVPRAITTAIPTPVTGKINTHARHSAKVTHVAMSRPSETPWDSSIVTLRDVV